MINIQSRWFYSFIIAGLLACEHKIKEEVVTVSKPNIIYILADDLSYKDLSVFGQSQYQTPNLDALCNQGIRYDQAYAAAGECAPSRGTLLTGLHTGHAPIRQNSSVRGQDHLRDEDITIAEVLKSAGYQTAFVGKWGIGQPGTEGVPYKQGFDYSFGFYDQVRAHTYFPNFLWENDQKIEYRANQGFNMQKRYDSNVREPGPEVLNEYTAEGKLVLSEVADPNGAVFSEAEMEKKALSFVDQNAEQPFFLYYATQLPHGPVIIDSLGADMNNRKDLPLKQREWAAMVQRLDYFTGQLVAKLKEKGVYENTLIVFSSDNGYSMAGYMGRGNAPDWENDPWLDNKGPFRGGKFSVLEGGCRVPMFAHWAGKIEPQVSQTPVWLPDWFATFAQLSAADSVPINDGADLQATWSMQETLLQDRALYFSRGREQAVRKGKWKAYRKTPDHDVELYDIANDSYSQNNLANDYPKVVQELTHVLNDSHTPSQWYWDPWENRIEYDAKKQLALETNQILPVIRPNSIQKLPWEK
ncbi:arylsulfatase [Reichenbachiella ulvae]|uniref:Arylsulfatase n=1 Tax=Reichenbachiella ulvae TaxID=2980104 RepID=A0ABT3D0D0_9BACT|nr:arylsulfatase [Reichenbachiella ulvae]MCV9389258.1 arylsulfatase [Reichenbachiella ulvae]